LTPPDVLREIEARGVAVRVEGDALKLKPAAALDARVLAEVLAMKPEIMALLKKREYSQRPDEKAAARRARLEAAYRGVIVSELYDPDAARVEAWRAFDDGEVTAQQRAALLAYADSEKPP